MDRQRQTAVSWVLAAGLSASAAWAVNIELVTVGNPGNTPDTRYANAGPGHGAVAYTYQIGKFEVTAGQYTEFLNAVAADDPYFLYVPAMGYNDPVWPGSNIQRSGEPGSYMYSVAADWAHRPVNWVSWATAARFCNWLTNGQPTGAQDLSITEDGSYFLNGLTYQEELHAVTRRPNARYVIPTEDEWYKSAYYDPNKPGAPGYWDYPTRSNDLPDNVLDPNGTNNANFKSGSQYTIGPNYYRTEVGSFVNAPSPYGTFDQAGNLIEWNESLHPIPGRGLRGGSWGTSSDAFHASAASGSSPYGIINDHVGFRVAYIPEPGSFALFVFASMVLIRRRR